jgi:rod shape-determining protein MreB and related proteins
MNEANTRIMIVAAAVIVRPVMASRRRTASVLSPTCSHSSRILEGSFVMGSMLAFLGRDMAVDLGTANTLVYVRRRGIALNEPSVVALNTNTGKVVAVGVQAKRMIGRTPGSIVAVRPLRDGVIADFDVTERMLRYFIQKVHRRRHLAKPRLVVDVGGGTTEVAVIALGGIVASDSVRVGGDEMDTAIIAFVKKEHSLMLGERTAEEIKMAIGSACPSPEEPHIEIRGRDLVSGLPKTIVISGGEVRHAIAEPVSAVVDIVKTTLDKCPPELAGDVMDRGVALTGGGALLRGLDQRLGDETGMPVYLADNPLESVVLGAGKCVEDFDALQQVLIADRRR